MEDARGSTPLDDARMYGHKKSVEALVAKGAKGGKPTGVARPAAAASLLSRDLKDGEAVVWYLGHSGRAVRTRTRLLIFDDWDRPNPPDDPALANGRIDPAEIRNLKVVAFSTHSHDDHYSPAILDCKKTIPDMTVVTGFEVRARRGSSTWPRGRNGRSTG